MKTKLLLFFVLLSSFSIGQITIVHTQFVDGTSPGAFYNSYATPIESPYFSVFVGEPSSTPQLWDFTDYDFNLVGQTAAIVPSSAPMISSFPVANAVFFEKFFEDGMDTLYGWNYKQLLSDKLLFLGMSDDTSVWYTYTPPAVQAVIPFTVGLSYMSQYDSVSIFPGYYYIITTTATIDAFGTMLLPSGTYPCLRVTLDDMNVMHTPGSVDTSYGRSYNFYADDLTEVHIGGISEEQFYMPTVDVYSIVYSQRVDPSAVGETLPDQHRGTLHQNRPNPFSTGTTITYSIPFTGFVTLTIFDITGNEVATLVNQQQSAGVHEISVDGAGLTAGVYYYRLTTGEAALTRKMTVIK